MANIGRKRQVCGWIRRIRRKVNFLFGLIAKLTKLVQLIPRALNNASNTNSKLETNNTNNGSSSNNNSSSNDNSQKWEQDKKYTDEHTGTHWFRTNFDVDEVIFYNYFPGRFTIKTIVIFITFGFVYFLFFCNRLPRKNLDGHLVVLPSTNSLREKYIACCLLLVAVWMWLKWFWSFEDMKNEWETKSILFPRVLCEIGLDLFSKDCDGNAFIGSEAIFFCVSLKSNFSCAFCWWGAQLRKHNLTKQYCDTQ